MTVGAALEGVAIREGDDSAVDRVLTPGAVAFISWLHREFEPRRQELLAARERRQQEIRTGARPDFLPATAHIRSADWQVAPAPADLDDRRVEITGPVDRKMMINALNSGANVFMADFEDALSPTWQNVIEGQVNLQDAVRRTLSLETTEKQYRLNEQIATLVVRPRGWHLVEKHFEVDGQPISASLFDFGLAFFHNAGAALERDSGPYFYLPKLESHLEARLWNDVFIAAQESQGIPRGSIRATVLIETVLAAFEMDEILYELREHAAGLNAGRWDYIFSIIKKFAHDPHFVLPDRAQVTMAVPFMSAYTDLLVKTCHQRGAHAIGGMAAFIPSRKDAEVTERALSKVREDKDRETGKGFDGTWVAHPDLVPIAREIFDATLANEPHQKHVTRPEVFLTAIDLLDTRIDDSAVTREGVATNIRVALQYIDAWLTGTGAVAINNLMEDAATAEISRAQLWQWRVHGTTLADGTHFTKELYQEIRAAECKALQQDGAHSRLADAAELLDQLVLDNEFQPFLTVPGYDRLA